MNRLCDSVQVREFPAIRERAWLRYSQCALCKSPREAEQRHFFAFTLK